MLRLKPGPGADEKKIFTMKMSIGVTLAMLGFGMYSHTKIQKLQQRTELYPDNHSNAFDDIPYTKLAAVKRPLGTTASEAPVTMIPNVPKSAV